MKPIYNFYDNWYFYQNYKDKTNSNAFKVIYGQTSSSSIY